MLPGADREDQRFWRERFASGPDGFLDWLNLTGWTFDPRRQGCRKHQPFLTWPVQEAAGRRIRAAIEEGGDVLIDKSRDMGATWLCLAAFAWMWLFVPDTPLLVASRKEEYVDGRGNPDTLFWKLDYLLAHLPGWLRPKIERRHMHLANLDNGSVIDGESTNADLGRGGRRKAILLDEFAAVENGAEILAATADAAPCRVFNSTPKGRGNAFAEVRFSGKVQVVTLHWKDHPEKGRGARLVADWRGEGILPLRPAAVPAAQDSTFGKEREQDALATQGRDALATSKRRWTSPWYESQCARRTSRKEVAQELDIDYLASGDAFFDLDVLQRLRTSGQLRPPMQRGELRFAVNTVTEGASYRLTGAEWAPDGGKRRLSLWCPLPPCHGGAGTIADCGFRISDWRLAPPSEVPAPIRNPESGASVGAVTDGHASARGANPKSEIRNPKSREGGSRPRQDRCYVAFADIAHGTGASNSVIKVADATTREEAASFVCPDTPPHELARYAVALCRWFGGRRPCLLGWEANGPGGIFGLEVFRLGYGAVLGADGGRRHWRPEEGVGWHSTRERKLDLLGDLRRALGRDELVLHDEAAVTELEQYIYYPSGAVGPSGLVEETQGARAAHGDRVIAAAGLLLCLAEQPPAEAAAASPPAGSFADRRQAHIEAHRQDGDW